MKEVTGFVKRVQNLSPATGGTFVFIMLKNKIARQQMHCFAVYFGIMVKYLSLLFIAMAVHAFAFASDSTLVLHDDDYRRVGSKMFIRFSNHQHGDLIIRIYDQEGLAVREYIDSGVEPGFHQTLLSLSDLRDGEYTLTLIMGRERRSAVFHKSEE